MSKNTILININFLFVELVPFIKLKCSIMDVYSIKKMFERQIPIIIYALKCIFKSSEPFFLLLLTRNLVKLYLLKQMYPLCPRYKIKLHKIHL